MALETVRKKLEAARKQFESERKKLGKELRASIVEAVAEVIPDGWYVRWTHSDQMYNDEDYYWDISPIQLVTLKVPREGELLKEEVPDTYKVSTEYWNRGQKVIDKYGSPAEYEYLLDDECEKRKNVMSMDWDDPGTVDCHPDERPDKLPFGLLKKQCNEVRDLISSFDQEELQSAFGDIATVVVFQNGKCKVNNEVEE